MTRITFDVPNAANAKNIASAVKQLKGVKNLQIHSEKEHIDDLVDELDLLPYPIPGLAYTLEERLANIRISEEQIRAGQTISMEELERDMAKW